MATAQEKLALARRHLPKALRAWHDPDWGDLSLFGFYTLEAAVDLAAIHHGLEPRKQHWARVEMAHELS